jgi:hypothetical protein
MSRSYISSPPKCLRGVLWDSFSFSFRRLAARGVEWIELAQDMNRLRALVNTVINLRVLALRRPIWLEPMLPNAVHSKLESCY